MVCCFGCSCSSCILRYNFALDVYPILSEFPSEALYLSMRIEQAVFDFLDTQSSKKLLCYLRMARDLGYVDERVYSFFEKKCIVL